jgi:tetratricopeptide (TPR) repeat protein
MLTQRIGFEHRGDKLASTPKPEQHDSPLSPGERLSLAGVLSLTFLTFVSTFSFGWVYDDPPQIPQNPYLQWHRLGYLFTHHLWASRAGTEARFYRPLLSLWFLINKSLFGLNPHWFHVTTVVAHVTATGMAFLIARKFLRDSGAALLAAAIFGVHPLQVEAASWISAVNDPLAAVLCFASFLAYRRARTAGQTSSVTGWWIISSISFFSALLTKEVSVALPAIVLIDFCTADGPAATKPSPRKVAMVATVYALTAGLWLVVRTLVLGRTATIGLLAARDTTLLTAPKLLLFDLYRVFFPIGLSPQYDFRPIESAGTEFIFALGILAALAWLAIAAARRNPQLWIAYAWLVFPLLPTTNLAWMNQDDFVHDRYMYMSMLGVALLAGFAYAALQRRWPHTRIVPLLCIVLMAGMGFVSAIQSQYWANDVFLFSHAVNIAPRNEWSHLNYGSALSARKRFSDAAAQFVESHKLQAGWQAADSAAYSYQSSGDISQAEHWFTVAAQENPELADAWFGLAQIRLEQHRPDDAISFLQKALAIQPDAEGYHYALGTALEQVSRASDALEAYKTELRLHPYQTGARKAIERLESIAPKIRKQ